MKISMLSTAFAIETILLVTIGGWFVQNHSALNKAGSADSGLPPSTKAATSASDLPADDPRTRHRHWKYQPQTTTVTIVGEVVDSWCYSSQVMGPGRGERHKACGLACAHGGVTLGIVDDEGTLYICAKHKAYTGCKELLTPFMAKRVKILGWLGQKGGCKVLKVAEVEEVKDGSAAGSTTTPAPAPTAAAKSGSHS
ncbi:MAG TPA: hypothetical protein V6C69_13995 [Trichormus sp.]|jgi:hypothetical protein